MSETRPSTLEALRCKTRLGARFWAQNRVLLQSSKIGTCVSQFQCVCVALCLSLSFSVFLLSLSLSLCLSVPMQALLQEELEALETQRSSLRKVGGCWF